MLSVVFTLVLLAVVLGTSVSQISVPVSFFPEGSITVRERSVDEQVMFSLIWSVGGNGFRSKVLLKEHG